MSDDKAPLVLTDKERHLIETLRGVGYGTTTVTLEVEVDVQASEPVFCHCQERIKL